MGAWSEEIFGNDTACDWAGGFVDAPSIAHVEKAFDAVLNETDYLDSDEACDALAASEVVARLSGRWGVKDAYSEGIDNWVTKNPVEIDDELREKALNAIDRIMGEDSELPDLWEGSAKWQAVIADLRLRVSG